MCNCIILSRAILSNYYVLKIILFNYYVLKIILSNYCGLHFIVTRNQGHIYALDVTSVHEVFALCKDISNI